MKWFFYLKILNVMIFWSFESFVEKYDVLGCLSLLEMFLESGWNNIVGM